MGHLQLKPQENLLGKDNVRLKEGHMCMKSM